MNNFKDANGVGLKGAAQFTETEIFGNEISNSLPKVRIRLKAQRINLVDQIYANVIPFLPADKRMQLEIIDSEINALSERSDARGPTTQEQIKLLTKEHNAIWQTVLAGPEGLTILARACDAVLTAMESEAGKKRRKKKAATPQGPV